MPNLKRVRFLSNLNSSYFDPTISSDTKGRSKSNEPGHHHIPVLYAPRDDAREFERLLLAFCALAIAQVTAGEPPPNGKIISGVNGHIRTVRSTDRFPKARQVVDEIARARNQEKPAPVLNRHCQVCDFEPRCRAIAVSREDLSLIGGMTEKERSKCREKGITNITQLSYGYRPRRRHHVKSTPTLGRLPVKHDHKLKALAIKKAQIHVIGSPDLSIEGTPVFLDVEGMPDCELYYLIGIRYSNQGVHIERSLWADRPEDEREIWQEFLIDSRGIENPRLVHYGAYEGRFLKIMRDRWKTSDADVAFVDLLFNRSVNLLAVIYGKIYFPTYSNSLKEIARWLGFEWTSPWASGGTAMLLRGCWELTHDDKLREDLIQYNIEDCRAAQFVADAILGICAGDGAGYSPKLKAVTASSLEVPFQRTFGKFPSAFPEFEAINAAAYWRPTEVKSLCPNRQEFYRRSVKRAEKHTKHVEVDKELTVTDVPERCTKCGDRKLWRCRQRSHLISDLKFTRRGIRRWNVRHHYTVFRCSKCKSEITNHSGRGSKYGPTLRAYIVYLIIELRLSKEKIREHLDTVFRLSILGARVHSIKRRIGA